MSNNIVHWTFLNSLGSSIPSILDKALNTPIINQVKSMKIYKTFDKFDRRVTSMVWHPTDPNTVAVGSKGGDLILWNFEQDVVEPRVFIQGIGAGGNIHSLIFDERVNGRSIFCVSMDGTLSLKSLEMRDRKPDNKFLNTSSHEVWYTSMGVSFPGRVMLAGDNKGFVDLLAIDGEPQWKKRLHAQKVNHIEFSPKESWCFVTASVDKTMKVWDLRNLKDKDSCLASHLHQRPVNSACFSRTDGGTLLTTDQHSQLRIYSCPSFSLSRIIEHPHRQFQHLTPIKATWHPLRDLAVVGRYPDPNFSSDDLRTVDLFDARTGQCLLQHLDARASQKILCLNQFNHQGDRLMSCVGSTVLVWKPNYSHMKSKEIFKDKKENDEDEEEEEKENKNRRSKYVRAAKNKQRKLELTKLGKKS